MAQRGIDALLAPILSAVSAVFGRLSEDPTFTSLREDPVVVISTVAGSFAALALGCLLCSKVASSLSASAADLVRFVAFVFLHLVDYVGNVLVMCIIVQTHHMQHLYYLVPVHVTIGLFSLYTAATCVDWESYKWPRVFVFLYIFLFLGLMQGIQIKLAHEEYQQRRRARHSDNTVDELLVPGMIPARFYCKAIDGLLNGTVFGFACFFLLLKYKVFRYDFTTGGLEGWSRTVLWVGACVSVLTSGLSLMEMDHRTSVAVQRVLNRSSISTVGHLIFRGAEVGVRLLTVCMFVSYMMQFDSVFFLAFVFIGVDYMLGILLLVCFGGRDPIREATPLLAVPLLLANVMQFVDAPGMSLQAKRMSRVLVPWRTLELIGMVAFMAINPERVHALSGINVYANGTEVEVGADVDIFPFLYEYETEWLCAWMIFGVCYYVLLFAYACRVTPEADIHSAIAYGELETLKDLLCATELVLDINRYGPDGRTPLHLAACLDQIDCLRLLLQEGADLGARTGDNHRSTALHLAAIHPSGEALQELTSHSSCDASVLNMQNLQGDTALHVVARRQNIVAIRALLGATGIDLNATNHRGLTAADCAPSAGFSFHKENAEVQIADLFRNAAAGRPLNGVSPGSLEMDSRVLEDAVPKASANEDADALPVRAGRSTSFFDSNTRSVVLEVVPERSRGQSSSSDRVLRQSTASDPRSSDSTGSFASRSSRNPLAGATSFTNVGFSSFMMSAGLGTLSRAFLTSIREEDDGTSAPAAGSGPTHGFDDFVEVRMLGEGAFGKVILVRHKDSGELYAMKMMDKAKFRAQKIVSKAHSEQFILKTTQHKFIVSLHYAFQVTTFWALIMDYCPNGDLHDALVAQGRPGMSLKDSARLGGEVLLALEHLHSISVIFRDLKLENVVVDGDFRARVTDFGLAKKLYSSEEARTKCGSFGYVAPEIMLGTGAYTYSVDLYSYGVMLYMLLSGGESTPKRPKQRLPPMKHGLLRRKLKEIKQEPPGEWAKPTIGIIDTLLSLTSDNISDRGTCATLKEHTFFTKQLGGPLDALLDDPGPFSPVGKNTSADS